MSNVHDCVSLLNSLADAVQDLADGMGGDRQEQERADDIAVALRHIALGQEVEPLLEHGAAREKWFADSEARRVRHLVENVRGPGVAEFDGIERLRAFAAQQLPSSIDNQAPWTWEQARAVARLMDLGFQRRGV